MIFQLSGDFDIDLICFGSLYHLLIESEQYPNKKCDAFRCHICISERFFHETEQVRKSCGPVFWTVLFQEQNEDKAIFLHEMLLCKYRIGVLTEHLKVFLMSLPSLILVDRVIVLGNYRRDCIEQPEAQDVFLGGDVEFEELR